MVIKNLVLLNSKANRMDRAQVIETYSFLEGMLLYLKKKQSCQSQLLILKVIYQSF